MRPGLRFVRANGHHRSPLFISPDGVDEWMERGDRSAEESLQVLKTYAVEPDLTCESGRQLKPGWEKRVSANAQKMREEERAIETVGELGIE